MVVQPGRDYNYPTSSGNAAASLGASQFTINGFHITISCLLMVVLLLIVWNLARRKR